VLHEVEGLFWEEEFCWRYNRRGLQPWLFNLALVNMAQNKPMPYKELTRF